MRHDESKEPLVDDSDVDARGTRSCRRDDA
jgi:hypothetical protein